MKFEGLDPRICNWLELEQTVNERIFPPPASKKIDLGGRTVQSHLHPGSRGVWEQEVVWLPRTHARVYGDPGAVLDPQSSNQLEAGLVPLLLHPQPTAALRRTADRYGKHILEGFRSSPTASFRSVLAWRPHEQPFVLKLSLGAHVAGLRRSLREREVAAAVTMSSLLDEIPERDREHHRFDWFPEPAGMVEAESGEGWLLRRMPRMMSDGKGQLVPLFSLISKRERQPPLLVEMIRRSRRSPNAFVSDELVRPYVDVLSYLLFVQGIQVDGHGQNVLFETDADGCLTGRVVLRDFSDASVNIALRVALGRPLPRIDLGESIVTCSFSRASVAADHHCNPHRQTPMRACDTVERFGLGAFIWSLNTSLARYFPEYDSKLTERRYLQLWQRAAVRLLGIRPLIRKDRTGLATDQAIAHFVRSTDWEASGASSAVSLPAGCEPMRIDPDVKRRRGPSYRRVECNWGELYLDGGLPAFFRPAF